MSARTREWYDSVMIEHGSPAMLELAESPWLELYLEAVARIRVEEAVVDLGCGTGRLLRLIQRDERMGGHYGKLTGVDFSATALAEAERYCSSGGVHDELPPVEWIEADLYDWRPDPDRAGNTVYVCTEVLEHLDFDQALVGLIPPGHRFIFSVPNYDSESHVRTFRNVGEAWERYGELLTFRRWALLGDDRKGVHVYEARRRADSW